MKVSRRRAIQLLARTGAGGVAGFSIVPRHVGKVTRVIGVDYAGAWECKLPAQPVPTTLDWEKWMGQVEPKPYNQNIQVSRSKPGWQPPRRGAPTVANRKMH